MKKGFVVIICLVAAIGLFGCSSGASNNTKEETSSESEQTQEVKDFDGAEYSDVGEGMFYVSTSAGTTEGNSMPKVTIDPDSIMQLGYTTKDMNSAPVTYIYYDGKEIDKKNMAVMSQNTFTVQEDMMIEGVHTIEAVQFEDDDPSGKVTMYKIAQIEFVHK